MISLKSWNTVFYIALILFSTVFIMNCNNKKSEEAVTFLNSKYKRSVMKDGYGNQMEITVDFSTEKSIDEEDLKVLKDIENITTIHMCECPITSKGISYLIPLKNLRVLTLEHTSLTDEGLQIISKSFPELIRLIINDTNVTSEGFKYISKLSKLDYLEMRKTKIDNKAIQYLSELNNLGYLGLSSTEISDESIPYLKNFKKMSVMFILYTQITREGSLLLQEHYKITNPKTTIYWDPNTAP